MELLKVADEQNFNSQPHKEADDTYTDKWKKREVFQLTASQGG